MDESNAVPHEHYEHIHLCRDCGDEIDYRRWALGYKFCLFCGEEHARAVKRCIVPMHKSNYMLITDHADLIGINNKGGLVK